MGFRLSVEIQSFLRLAFLITFRDGEYLRTHIFILIFRQHSRLYVSVSLLIFFFFFFLRAIYVKNRLKPLNLRAQLRVFSEKIRTHLGT